MRFTVEAGGARARAVAFGDEPAARRPTSRRRDVHARGQRVERRGRAAAGPAPRRSRRRRRRSRSSASPRTPARRARWPSSTAPLRGRRGATSRGAPARPSRDRRGGGVAGTLAALVASGEPVLVVVRRRPRAARGTSTGRLGGFALCSWDALERDPALIADELRARRRARPAGVRRPGRAARRALHAAGGAPGLGSAELRFTADARGRYDLARAAAHRASTAAPARRGAGAPLRRTALRGAERAAPRDRGARRAPAARPRASSGSSTLDARRRGARRARRARRAHRRSSARRPTAPTQRPAARRDGDG